MDATYRANLRELNELNFARFDAKFEQRVTALESKLEQRLAALESRFEQRLTHAISQLRDELSDKIGDTKSSLLRWMFGFWVGAALVILGSRLAL